MGLSITCCSLSLICVLVRGELLKYVVGVARRASLAFSSILRLLFTSIISDKDTHYNVNLNTPNKSFPPFPRLLEYEACTPIPEEPETDTHYRDPCFKGEIYGEKLELRCVPNPLGQTQLCPSGLETQLVDAYAAMELISPTPTPTPRSSRQYYKVTVLPPGQTAQAQRRYHGYIRSSDHFVVHIYSSRVTDSSPDPKISTLYTSWSHCPTEQHTTSQYVLKFPLYLSPRKADLPIHPLEQLHICHRNVMAGTRTGKIIHTRHGAPFTGKIGRS